MNFPENGLRAARLPIPRVCETSAFRLALLLALLCLAGLAQAAAPCERCHRSTISFAGARMDHTGIVDSCSRCHNGVQAPGKPHNHIVTAQSCETCHFSTHSFDGGSMNHAGISGNCASCHNGLQALGKPPNHVPTTAPCEQCHRPTQFVSFAGAKMDHTGIVNGCAGCHGGGSAGATTKPASHIPTSQDCSVCHLSTVSFAQMRMDHAGISGNCVQCHGGQYSGVAAKTAVNHIPTTAACETCHSPTNFSSFAGARMDHAGAGITVGSRTCNNCHETGSSYAGITDTRPPASFMVCSGPSEPHNQQLFKKCDDCHTSTSNWTAQNYCP